jgi:hypothetical protein
MASREQIISTLFQAIVAAGSFVTTGRRLVNPEQLGPELSPAFFLIAHEDGYDRSKSFDLLPIRDIQLQAFLYNDVGPTNYSAIPESPINDALDMLDTLFKPDNVATGAYTLGGLVTTCMIDGTILRASGDVTGKALAVVPIRIVLP